MSKKHDDEHYVVSLEELLEAGVHFGHQSRRWYPKMEPYIWGERAGVHIFDLKKTQDCLRRACLFLRDQVSQGKIVLFVGTKRQATSVIREEAEKAGAPYVATRWPGGLMTNWNQIKKSLKKLRDLRVQKEAGELDRYTKKEQVLIGREISRLTRLFGGVEQLENPPDILFVVDVKREIAAVSEARTLGIPIIAILDTNCDPGVAEYVIPANDDAVRSIHLIVSKLADAVLEGKKTLGHPERPRRHVGGVEGSSEAA